MEKTKRILMAERIERAVNEKLKKEEKKMTRGKIDRKINMQKIHNARTKRAKKNLNENEKLQAHYGGLYTQSESNLLCDLHPYFKKMKEDRAIKPKKLSEEKIFESLKALKRMEMLKMYIQEDNHLMI